MNMLDASIAADSTSTDPDELAGTGSTLCQEAAIRRALKSSTAAAYEKDVRQYREVFGGCIPCDQAALKRYIAWLRTRVAPTTMHRRLMALRHEHIRLGHPSPTDAPVLSPTEN